MTRIILSILSDNVIDSITPIRSKDAVDKHG